MSLERRIRPEEFGGGVLEWFGLNLVTDVSLYFVSKDRPPSYRDLAFRGEDVRNLWPRSATAAQEDVRAASEPRTARGGLPPVHGWRNFTTEVVRVAALDGMEITKGELKRRMKAWTATAMESAPDDRTIEKKVDEIAGDVFPD